MRIQYMTGLDDEQFDELLGRVEELIESGKGGQPDRGGRPWKLPLRERLEMVLAMLRHNITQQLAAQIWGVSQPRVSKTKKHLEPRLFQALLFTGIALEEAARTRPLLVDGTFVPTGNRKKTKKANYSGKHHEQCLNIQVASELDAGLIAASDPVPGARHDSAALEITGWDQILKDANWAGDTAYIKHTALTPDKRKPGVALTDSQKEYNKQISAIRCAVERCIGHLKNWKILATGYRRQLKYLPDVIALVAKLELYRIGW